LQLGRWNNKLLPIGDYARAAEVATRNYWDFHGCSKGHILEFMWQATYADSELSMEAAETFVRILADLEESRYKIQCQADKAVQSVVSRYTTGVSP
jgi:hypothetical protein